MSVNLNDRDFSAGLITLDKEHKPEDADQFLKGLNLLASQALDALKKPEDVELAFQRIKSANLVDLSPQEKDSIDQRIQDVYKSWVKVTFGDYFRYVPRERLAVQCGPKFKAQYTSRMKEATDQGLDLQSADADESPTGGCPEDCKELVLVYLQTGALPPGALGDNALNMLVLAEQHQLEGLVQDCLDFLIDNLSHENLDTYLEFTEQTPFPRLEVACLNFMKDNRFSISDALKTKYQEVLSIVEALVGDKITFKLSSSGMIEAEVFTSLRQTVDVLQKINERFPITSLILRGVRRYVRFTCLEQIAHTLKNLQELIIWNETPTDDDFLKLKHLFPNLTALGNNADFLKTFDEVKTYVGNFRRPGEDDQESNTPLLRSLNLGRDLSLTDDQLDELTPYLQELHQLFIKSDNITSVFAPKATVVFCSHCAALTNLEAPKATIVYCDYCSALTILEVPEATLVSCSGCIAFTTLEVPKATSVSCSDCKQLTTLEAPKATSVSCSGCTQLTTLEAPETTDVNCSGCTNLTTLEAPEATDVNCSGCTNLTILKTPIATMVECNNCTALTTLQAPEATTIACNHCNELTTLQAPEATTIACNHCNELTTLEAPKATKVECNGCTALTTLEVSKATKVECKGCTQLTTLEVPKATEVNCYGCTQIATLEVSKATKVECSRCTALTSLVAPKATKVECGSCTRLTTLKAPEATTVDCGSCTVLTNLELPEGTEVDCSSCAALTTLEVPKAAKIYCGHCSALTNLELPVATEVRCRRCTALTTIEAPIATKVECMNCTALTTLKAPKATEVRSEGCTALTIPEAPYCTLL